MATSPSQRARRAPVAHSKRSKPAVRKAAAAVKRRAAAKVRHAVSKVARHLPKRAKRNSPPHRTAAPRQTDVSGAAQAVLKSFVKLLKSVRTSAEQLSAAQRAKLQKAMQHAHAALD